MKTIFLLPFLLCNSFVLAQNNQLLTNIATDNNQGAKNKTFIPHNAFHAPPARVDSSKKSSEKDTVDLIESPLINTKVNKNKEKKKE